MKKRIYLMLLGVLLSFTGTMAQVVQTVNVPTAGGLATAIGSNLKTVTDLTLTGTINATDFNTIKQMTALKNLDMLKVAVVGNAIPAYAFQNRVLERLNIPEGITTINDDAFQTSKIEQGLILPSTVTTIGNNAFTNMTTMVDLSQAKNTLSSLGLNVFSNYSGSKELNFSDYTSLKNFSYSSGYVLGTFPVIPVMYYYPKT